MAGSLFRAQAYCVVPFGADAGVPGGAHVLTSPPGCSPAANCCDMLMARRLVMMGLPQRSGVLNIRQAGGSVSRSGARQFECALTV